MRDHPPCPRGGAPGRDPAGARDPPARRARAGAAEPGERHRRAARRGHRRLGRRLPGHRRLRQPRAPVAVAAAPARGHRGRAATSSPRAWRSTPSSSTWLHPACASRCSTAPTPRASAATTRAPCSRSASEDVANVADGAEVKLTGRRSTAWYSGADAQPMELPLTRRGPRRDAGGARRRPRRAGARASRRSSRSSARAAPRSAPSPSSPTSCARPTIGDTVTFVTHPQHQLHEPVHLQVQLLRVRQGPAQPQPARQAVPAHARGDRRPRPRGVGGRRHRGVPAGRHPPDLRRRLLLAGLPGGPRRGAGDPRPRLHRARGHRRRAAPGRAARGLPAPDEGRGPGARSRARPRRSSTTRSARSCARTRSTRTSGWRRTGSRTPSACARTSRSCSAPSSRRCPGRAT